MEGKRLPQSALTSVLVFFVGTAFLAAAASGGIDHILLLGFGLIGFFAAVFFLRQPMFLIVVGVMWYSFAFLSTNTYFPMLHARLGSVTRYVDELLLIPLFAVLAIRIVLKKEAPAQRALNLWMILAGVALLSGFINSAGIKSSLSYMQAYYRHFVLLIAGSMVFNPTHKNFRRIGFAFAAFLFIQLAFDLVWLADVPPFRHRFSGQPYDWAVGSMGLTSTVCYVSIAGITAGMVMFLRERRPTRRMGWLAVSLASLVLLAIGHTKHATLLGAASISVSFFIASRGFPVRRFLLLLLVVGLTVGVTELYNTAYRSKKSAWYSQTTISRTLASKIRVHENVFRELSESRTWFLGKGPGQFSSVVALWNRAPLFNRYFYAELEQKRYNPRSTVMLYPRTGFLSLLGDTGLIGLGLYIFLCAYAFWHIFQQTWRGAYDSSPFAYCAAVSWCGWMAFYFLLNLLADVLNFGLLPFLTWSWAAILWHPPIPDKEDDKSAPPSKEDTPAESSNLIPC